jgi:anhydro-N-acetylmuramic acid kinase
MEYIAIGVMSGTSLDGMDLVLCNLTFKNNKWDYNILTSKHISYSKKWEKRLQHSPKLSSRELLLLHHNYGQFIGTNILQLLEETGIVPDIISSHGHTVFHQPERHLTFQLGDGASIAATTGILTVSDIRNTDVALGGQGAPLVPIGDRLLFGDYDYCLNLGGIANISYEDTNMRRAFDICPCNMLSNYLVNKIGLSYDESGNLGKEASPYKEMLVELNRLNYYHRTPPKSLGKEWFDEVLVPVIDKYDVDIATKLATAYEHIAEQIKNAIHQDNKQKKLLITGGGAWNKELIRKISEKLDLRVVIPDEEIINNKEALVFALLGVLRIRNEINCLSSVTGAKKDNTGGAIYM